MSINGNRHLYDVAVIVAIALSISGQGRSSVSESSQTALGSTVTSEGPWGQPVMGLRMRVSGQSDLTWPAERTVVVLELENVGDTPILFRQLSVNTIPEVLAKSGQHLRVKGWIGVNAWTTWTGAIEPGDVMAWREHLSRMRFVDPPKQGTEIQVRFLLRFRSKPPEPRVTHPLFTVFSNALTVKVIEPLPDDARTPADIPAKWNRSMYLVWGQGSGIGGKRTLHIDGSGRAQLVRPPYGYKDTLVPWGSYEAALSPTRLSRIIQVLREEPTWRQLELVESGPGIDQEEIHIALTWHGGTLLRSFPGKATREYEAVHLLRHEMEVLMAEVVAQHKSRQRGSDEE
jgi:hypothetical protein